MKAMSTQSFTQPTEESETLEVYRAHARHLQAEKDQSIAKRRLDALEVARQAADVLKNQFGATSVVLFGSLAHNHWFSTTSDIDLAVTGVDPDSYFFAVAQLQIIHMDFKIDLVLRDRCKPSLAQQIAIEGQPL